MLAEIFMLKAEAAARVAKEAVPRFVPITLPAARPVDDALALVSPPRARRRCRGATAMSVVMLTTDYQEAAMMKFASEQLKLVRTYSPFGGDPFTGATMHAMVRRTLKGLAEVHERNMARIVDLALAGAEDAAEALKDLIAERNKAGLPLAGALGTFDTILNDRPPNYRRPAVRPGRESFLENFVIVCLIITLMREFPRLKLRRSPTSKRLSAYSIMASTLIDAGLGRGGEEAIRKIWERYGPPVCPGFHWNPPQK
jgi:hypothetical protein